MKIQVARNKSVTKAMPYRTDRDSVENEKGVEWSVSVTADAHIHQVDQLLHHDWCGTCSKLTMDQHFSQTCPQHDTKTPSHAKNRQQIESTNEKWHRREVATGMGLANIGIPTLCAGRDSVRL